MKKKMKFTATAIAASILVSGGSFAAINLVGAAPASASVTESKPVVSTVKTTIDTITLSWNPNPGEEVIQYETELLDSKGVRVEAWKGRETSITFSHLTPDTTYTVLQSAITKQIRASDGLSVQRRGPTSTFTVTTQAGTLPALPEPKAAKAPSATTIFKTKSVSYNQAELYWQEPSNIFGQVKSYTVTIKQSGKADRVVTVPAAVATIINSYKVTGLAENTAYIAQVKANVVAWEAGGKPATSPAASLSIKTPYNPDRVVGKAPTSLKAGRPSVNAFYYWRSFDISWKAPTGIIGKVKNYTVTVKQGSKVVSTVTTTSTKTNNNKVLKGNTTYTVSVKANIVSANGKKAVSVSTGSISYKTPPEPSGNVTVSAPKISFSNLGSNRFTTNWSYTTTGKTAATAIQWYDGNKRIAHSGGGSYDPKKALISGLKPGKKYRVEVQITAISPNGAKLVKSSARAYVTTAPASAVKVSTPYSLKASTTTNTISSTWGLADNFIGKNPTFTVTLKQGTKVVKTVTTSELRYKFSGLKGQTGYTVQVKANGVSLDGKKKTSSPTISLNTKTK